MTVLSYDNIQILLSIKYRLIMILIYIRNKTKVTKHIINQNAYFALLMDNKLLLNIYYCYNNIFQKYIPNSLLDSGHWNICGLLEQQNKYRIYSTETNIFMQQCIQIHIQSNTITIPTKFFIYCFDFGYARWL